MLGLSPVRLMILLIAGLILLGPDKLPEAARQVGASWRAFRTFRDSVESQIRETIPDLPSTGDLARMARSPVTILNKLADFDVQQNPVQPDPGVTEQASPEVHQDPGADAVLRTTSDEPDDVGTVEPILPQFPERPSFVAGDPGLN